MKSLRAIFACFFALLVFVSSSSFSIGLHLCAGTLNGIAFLDKADGCGHQKLPPCHRQLMKGCCEDEVVSHAGQDFSHSLASVPVVTSPVIDITIPPVWQLDVIPPVEIYTTTFADYDSPLRSVDRTVVNSIFLI